MYGLGIKGSLRSLFALFEWQNPSPVPISKFYLHLVKLLVVVVLMWIGDVGKLSLKARGPQSLFKRIKRSVGIDEVVLV